MLLSSSKIFNMLCKFINVSFHLLSILSEYLPENILCHAFIVLSHLLIYFSGSRKFDVVRSTLARGVTLLFAGYHAAHDLRDVPLLGAVLGEGDFFSP